MALTETGTINAIGDSDWIKITMTANTLYKIESGFMETLQVYDSTGTLVGGSDSYGLGTLGFMTKTSGTYYIGVTGQFMAGSYTLTATNIADDFRNNTTTTGVLANGGTKSGTINTTGESDWFKVSLNANTLYKIQTKVGGVIDADRHLQIYDATGKAVGAIDASNLGQLAFTTKTAGTYYVGLDAGTMGAYTVNMSTVADDFRSNNTTTGVLATGGTKSGTINAIGDNDWLKVTLNANTLYKIQAKVGGVIDDDKGLQIYDATGKALGAVDAYGSGQLAFMTKTAGTYYVGVAGQDTGAYTVNMTTNVDDFRSNNTTTGVLPTGGTKNGTINAIGDNDWFKVTLNANTLYKIQAKVGGSVDDGKWLQVYNSAGQAVGTIDSFGAGNLAFMTKTAGTYYVGIADQASPIGAYTVNMSTVADDFRNNSTTTGVLATGGTKSGIINAAGDNDWFKVTLNANTLYKIQAKVGGTVDTMKGLQIYDSTGKAVGEIDAFGTGQLAFMTKTAGTYYLGVTSYGGGTAYTVSMATNADDFRDNPTTSGAAAMSAAHHSEPFSLVGINSHFASHADDFGA